MAQNESAFDKFYATVKKTGDTGGRPIQPTNNISVKFFSNVKPVASSQPLTVTPQKFEQNVFQKTAQTVTSQIKGINIAELGKSFVAGAKSLPGMVKQAGGIIAGTWVGQQQSVNSFFKKTPEPVKNILRSVSPQFQAFEKVQDAVEKIATKSVAPKALELREQGTKETQFARNEYQKNKQPSQGLQGLLEMVTYNLPQVAASTGLSLATAFVTKNPLAGAAVGLSTSYGLGASEVYNQARSDGQSDKQALPLSMIGGAVIGAIDFLPLGKLLGKIGAVETVKKSLIKNIATNIVSIGTQAGFEGITEGLQEIIGNAVARTYNENQDLFEGVKESAIVGAILGGVTDVSLSTAIAVTGKGDVKATIQSIEKKVDEALSTPAEKRTPEQKMIAATILTQSLTPDDAMSFVLENDLGKTETGKEIVKLVAQGKQQGKNLRMTPGTDGDSLDVTLVDPNQENLAASSGESVGESSNSINKDAGLLPAETKAPSLNTSKVGSEVPSPRDNLKTSSPERTNFTSRYFMKSPSQSDYSRFYEEIQSKEPEFISTLDKIAQDTGFNIVERIKTQDSLVGKIARKRKSLGEMNDVLASTVVVDTPKDIEKAIASVKNKANITNVTDYRSSPTFLGYKAIHMDYELSNGAVTEIQVNTREGMYQKAYAHEIYNKWRKYIENNGNTTFDDVFNDIQKKEPGKLEEFRVDIQLSRDIYDGKVEIPQEYIDFVNKSIVETKEKIAAEISKQPQKQQVTSKNPKGRSANSIDGLRLAMEKSDTPQIAEKNLIKFADSYIEGADKRQLLDLRAALVKEVTILTGGTGNYKKDYAMRVALRDDVDVGGLIRKFEDYIAQIDELVPKTPERAEPIILKPKGKSAIEMTAPLPVGQGKLKKSKAYTRVYDRLEVETRTDTTYNRLNLKDDAKKAIELIESNPQKALRVALGIDPPPVGQTETAISIALADRAGIEENYQLQSQLESIRSLRQTRRGQEIVAERGRFNDESPYRYVQTLLDRRLREIGKGVIPTSAEEIQSILNKGGSKKRAVEKVDRVAKELKTRLTKEQTKINLAQDIINSLIC